MIAMLGILWDWNMTVLLRGRTGFAFDSRGSGFWSHGKIFLTTAVIISYNQGNSILRGNIESELTDASRLKAQQSLSDIFFVACS